MQCPCWWLSSSREARDQTRIGGTWSRHRGLSGPSGEADPVLGSQARWEWTPLWPVKQSVQLFMLFKTCMLCCVMCRELLPQRAALLRVLDTYRAAVHHSGRAGLQHFLMACRSPVTMQVLTVQRVFLSTPFRSLPEALSSLVTMQVARAAVHGYHVAVHRLVISLPCITLGASSKRDMLNAPA